MSQGIEDVLLLIFAHLSIEDILSASLVSSPITSKPRISHLSYLKTCKTWAQACGAKQLWIHLWQRDVLDQHLPIPDNMQSLDLMDEAQTRAIVTHALRLQRSMSQSSDHRQSIYQASIGLSRSVTWIRVISSEWLLVATSNSSCSTLSLYSVASLLRKLSDVPIAEVYLDGPVRDGLVDLHNDKGIVIAAELQCSRCVNTKLRDQDPFHSYIYSPQLEILSICVYEGHPKFIRLALFSDLSYIRALHGSLLGFSLHGDLSVPSILNWQTGQITHLRDRPSIYVSSPNLSADFSITNYRDARTLWLLMENILPSLTIQAFASPVTHPLRLLLYRCMLPSRWKA